MPTHLSHKIETLQVKTCIEMALRCVVANWKERPSIKDIIDEVEKLEAEIKKMSLPSKESQVLTVQVQSFVRKKIWPSITKITF